MIKRFIANIRRKPAAVRESVALWIAVSFTVAVGIVWLYHLPSRFDGKIITFEEPTKVKDMFGEFQDQLSSARSSVPEEQPTREEAVLDTMVETFRDRGGVGEGDLRIASTTASSSTQLSSSTQTVESAPKPQSIRIITTSEAGTSSSQQTQ